MASTRVFSLQNGQTVASMEESPSDSKALVLSSHPRGAQPQEEQAIRIPGPPSCSNGLSSEATWKDLALVLVAVVQGWAEPKREG